jgi:DNA repair exonuclease SbcCD ATPase subunit
MTDKLLQISHLKISNILGIDELEFSPEGFNEIRGKNGEGKTSVLEAIKAATGQGHDATLLRLGADEGEIVLVLDDGAEIKKRVTGLRSTTSVTDADGKKVTKPAEFMKSLVDSLSVNPVAFLTAQPKDRVKVLLEAMPIEIDAERLESIGGMAPIMDGSIHGLAIIDEIRKRVYEDRTGTNRAVKEKDNTINQLQLAMPDVPGGAEGNEDELRAKVEESTSKKDAELTRVRDKLDGIKSDNQKKIDGIRAEAQGKVDEIRAETQRQIDELKAKGSAEVEAINNTSNAAIETIQTGEREIEQKAGQQREKTIQTHNDTVGPINQTLEAIRTNRSAHAKREQALETIKLLEKELEDLKLDAAAQTKALEDIDAYKLELLAALPIPGVEVRDGEIYRGGVVFDRLNTAQQVEIAVEIAKLRTGDLGICCVDRLECLDPDAFAAFREQVLESGLQLFVTTVNGEEFNVQTTA